MLTARHRKRNLRLHKANAQYGAQGGRYASGVVSLIEHYGISSLLDFGCGKGDLVKAVSSRKPEVTAHGYDPCVPGFTKLPKEPRYDMVTCIHVLEHVEPTQLLRILQYLDYISGKVLYIDVKDSRHSGPVFLDGSGSNTVQMSADGWSELLEMAFGEYRKYLVDRKLFISAGLLRTTVLRGEDIGMVVIK